jgi:hypothetical protein
MKTGHFKRLIPMLLALVFSVLVSDFAFAQAPVSICILKDRNQGGATMQDCVPVGTGSGYTSLPTTTSGGGGGSTADQTAFTQGTSAFVPVGGVFNDTATLSSGQEGTVRLTTDRQMKVLDSAVLAAVQAPIPAGTNAIGNVGYTSQYPVGAVPYTASATGTTTATAATLTGAASVTTYICGFSIRANATAAVTNNSTVSGTVTGTLNFTQWTAPAASGIGITEMIFNPCVPASAANTSVVVTSGAPGTGGVVSVSAWGYKL